MNIDTGRVHTSEEEDLIRAGFSAKDVIEMHESEFTEKELEAKQVDLSSNTRAAGHARYFRNMRNFVQNKQGR